MQDFLLNTRRGDRQLMTEKQFQDTLPPSDDCLDVPGCEVILMSPQNKPIAASRAAAILMRLAGQRPNALVDFWVKVRD